MKNEKKDVRPKEPYLVITLDKSGNSYWLTPVSATDEEEAGVLALQDRAEKVGAEVKRYKEGEFDEDGGRDGIVPVLILKKCEVDRYVSLMQEMQAEQ
jgi:hypothetical protein